MKSMIASTNSMMRIKEQELRKYKKGNKNQDSIINQNSISPTNNNHQK